MTSELAYVKREAASRFDRAVIVSALSASILLFVIAPGIASGADIYVSLSGNDANSGAKTSPVASLAAARNIARKYAGKERVTVHVAEGTYYLPETLVFTSEDSGSRQHPVVYKAQTEGGAILSGGAELKVSWELHPGGIFKAQTPAGLKIDQLFINGQNQRMARYPNYDASKKAEPYQGFAADAFAKERAATWTDPSGGYIHAMHRAGWGGYHYRITGKGDDGEVTYEGGWQNNRRMGMHQNHRMVENIFEELDAPGEWFHDDKSSTLYYQPKAGIDLSTTKVEVVRLRHLVEFQGSEKSPVRFITLQGFRVRHAARTFMDCKEPLLRSDWAIYRGGAFVLTGTEDVGILDCEFDQVGGNAVFVNNYNRRALVKGCHIHDTGASGVCFVGDPNAVRNPLFEYGQKNDLSKIDRSVGPKTNNYPAESIVEDCLIHGIGRVERQPAGVQIEMASEITVRDCSIYDTARAGINIGDGAWGGHLIERCDVFDTVLETHDHGSFNSWGRDRYWRSDHLTASQNAVDAEPNLPFLDAMKTTVIRNSRWRCDHGWDIDLDDGSSNYDIYNNLLLNKGLKLREGFRRHAWNNVMPAGTLHPHVWFQRSKDQVHTNIMTERYHTARMDEPYNDGTMVDRNLFDSTDSSILKHSMKLGWDTNSVLAEPVYVDAKNGDFRVKEESPAIKLGFKNFPMDQFGVKKSSLKAIARTPELPSTEKATSRSKGKRQRTAEAPLQMVWLGATLKDLKGDEFSAFGVSKEAGGVAVAEVANGSAADKAGLRKGDLIQAINGKAIATIDQLFISLLPLETSRVSEGRALKIIRNQKPIKLTATPRSVAVTETAANVNAFKTLPVPKSTARKVTANVKTSNDPLRTLTDGKLDEGYGPIFGNGIHNGAYKMDLGRSKAVKAITSWSHSKGGKRGAQKLTIYGSNATIDPGWNLEKFSPLGTIVTGPGKSKFTATSLRATDGKTLGHYRWILWRVAPISDLGGGENTAFQELSVATDPVEADVSAKNSDGPNIVFLMSDDQRWDMFGCYGRTDVRTPHIDQLAAQGVTFDNAHYAVAICMPSRATMFTGRYFSDHRSGFTFPYNRTLSKDEFADSYPARLRDAGYRTGFVGKFGTRLQGNHNSAPEYFDYFVNGNSIVVPKDDADLKRIYRRDRPKEERTIIKGDAMIRFLETQPKDQPFCLSISFDAVKNDRDHDMYSPHVKLFDDQEMWVPENWVEGKNSRLPKLLDHCRGTYLHVARTSTKELYQKVARRFSVQGYTVDKQVGRLMKKLEEMGVLNNTIVIYTSDNGRFHGSQGLFDKAILYEEAMKMPLIVFDGRASKEERGRRAAALVSSADLAPTMLSLAGVDIPQRMKGRDLSNVLRGTQDMSQWRDALLLENFFIQEIHSAGVRKHPDIPSLNDEIVTNNRSYRSRGVRTDRYKYFKYFEHNPPIEELYDLKSDPHEQTNLVADENYADILSGLRKKTQELHAHATNPTTSQ